LLKSAPPLTIAKLKTIIAPACLSHCRGERLPHPEELAKQASRRMDTTQGLAAILRDAQGRAPQDEVGGFRSHTGRRDGGGAKVELLGLRRLSTGIATQRCEPAK
jgi:hypothetical protein